MNANGLMASRRLLEESDRRLEEYDVHVLIIGRDHVGPSGYLDLSDMLDISVALIKNKPIGLLIERDFVVSDKLKIVANAIEFFNANDTLSVESSMKRLMAKLGC